MAIIDDKIVSMSFESSKFESGVKNVIDAMDKLKASLQKLPSSGKGLDDIGAAAKRIDLSHIGKSLDSIQQKLGYFSIAAIAIFTNIAMKAVQTGAQMVKALTLDPIIQGYKEYSIQLNSIQTILANTQAAGTNLKQVNATLRELNEYSDKTIYNFAEMARNIGTFTAAGVDLKTSTAAIKGIANLAALSGSNSQQASTAMYQLSQAIAAGRVSLMDWNSVVNAGMGGTVFQRALAQTAVAMGKLPESAVKLVGPMKNVSIHGQSFRNAIATKPGEKSWLTSDVLTTALKTFTSDMTDAELAAIGFTKEQIKAIQQTANTAMHAATEVKTLSQVLDVAKETAGSGWAQTWQIIFGDFGEAKKTFTDLSNTINGFINKNADARNKVLQDWKDLGGRTVLIDSIKTAFHNLGLILKPIKEAFRDIFPAKTGADLMYLTQRFERFAEALKPSEETIKNLHRTFQGVFAAFDIGKQIISGIFTAFKSLFETLGAGDGGFLSFTARIGDWIVALDKALKKGDILNKFFAGLGKVIAIPFKILGEFVELIQNLFTGGASSVGTLTSNFDKITVAATPLSKVLDVLSRAWERFSNALKDSIDAQGILESIGTALSGIGSAIGRAASTMNFDAIFQIIRTGLFAGLVLMFKNFLGKGSFLEQFSKGFAGGILNNISGIFTNLNGVFNGLNKSMGAMQQNIKAKTLKEIAIAIALLAASVLVLSLVDPKKLNSALGAMTVMFGELIGAMALLDKVTKSGGFIKLPIIIAGLVGLAIAIDLLTLAVLALSRLSWDELLRGLAGIGGSLFIMVKAIEPLGANSAGLIRASVGIGLLAISLNIMALAVRQFASMNMVDLGKGLGGVSIALTAMVVAMKKMPAKPVSVAGLIAMGIALNILALAVKQFAGMSMAELGKGLGGIAIGLGAMVVAMRKMPPTMAASAAQLLAMAGAIWILSEAVFKMGGMSISQIAKGLGALAGSLVILGTALKYMSANVRGAAALTLTAAAIGILAPALVMLGKQSLGEIVKSMIALAGALVIMGVAGVALAPVAPALLALGIAVALIGGGLALAGAGLLAIAAGISALAVAGPAGIGIMVAALNEFYKTIPELAKNLVLALLEIVNGLANSAPQFVAALVKILNSLLDVIIQSSPKFAEAFIALIDVLLRVLSERQNEIIAAGFALLIALLQGIKDNIGEITKMVIEIIATFLKSLAANVSQIVKGGFDVLIAFLKGIANNIGRVVTAAADIIVNFLNGIANNLSRIVTAGMNIIIKFVEGIGKNLTKLVTAGGDAIASVVEGIGKAANKVVNAAADTAGTFIKNLAKAVVKLANDVATAIITLLNGVADIIETRSPEVYIAMARIGAAMITGMANAIRAGVGEIKDALLSLIPGPLRRFAGKLGIDSPSKVFYGFGKNIVEGLALGLTENRALLSSAMTGLGNSIVAASQANLKGNIPQVLREIGVFINQEFIKGLRGSPDDIRSAFTEMNSQLTEAIQNSRETIASEQKKLKELLGADKPDLEAIRESQRLIKENQTILLRSISTRDTLRTKLADERLALIKLSAEYDRNNAKIDAAKQKLADLIAEKEAFTKSTTEQYATLPQIQTTDAEGNALTPEQQVQNYLEALKTQAAAVATYKTTLDELRKLGLDDATYQKLLTEGTADQSFANQLLAGGKTAIQALNVLDADLLKVSKSLAISAAKNLKQAGIDAAKGLLAGLQSQNDEIREAMEKLVQELVNAVKRKLSIRSPSKVFEEIGSYSMQGLANGFAKASKFVTDALISATDSALDSMKSTMRKISDVVTLDLNQNPVITPILDLSQVRSQAGTLAALTNVTPITAAASYNQASMISAEQIAAQMEEISSAASLGTTVKFEQNNYSPKALTEIEIYRQTKNQLSQVKSLLAVT